MKKIIVILIFLFNILPSFHNNEMSLSIGSNAHAQQNPWGTGCSNNSGPGNLPGNSTSWWSIFTGAIIDAGNWIGQQWSSGGTSSSSSSSPWSVWQGTYGYTANPNAYGSGGAGYNNVPPTGTGLFTGINPAGYYMNGTLPPPLFNTATAPTWTPAVPCDPITNPLCITLVFTNVYDCAGQIYTYNNAVLDVCGRCAGGSTNITPCNLITQTLGDTVKATKVDCDTIDTKRNIRATKSTQILDAIKDSAETKNARDSAPFRKFEVGFTITRAQPQPGIYTYRPRNYEKDGASQSVSVDIEQRSVAWLHVHPKETSAGVKNVESQSPYDLYDILERWNNPFYINKFERAYVISGDSARNEYAVVIADSAKAKQFLLNHPKSTVINLDTTSKYLANWSGGIDSIGTYLYYFQEANKMFAKEGYPEHLLNTYANVYMLQEFDLGIKLQQKVNGQFKELNFVKETDPVTGLEHFKITICQ
jgi:hypothetical protein